MSRLGNLAHDTLGHVIVHCHVIGNIEWNNIKIKNVNEVKGKNCE